MLTLIKVIHDTQADFPSSRRGPTRCFLVLLMRGHPSAQPELVLVRTPRNMFAMHF